MRIRAYGHWYDTELKIGKYPNGQTFVALIEEGCPFGKLTFADENIKLAEDEILVKTWSENKDWYEQVLEHDAFTATDRLISLGFDVVGEVWKLDRSKL
jgi:hypothetical protein